MFPWEIHFPAFAFDFEQTDDGGIILALMPGVPDQSGGFAMMPPPVKVKFSKEGWEMFKRRVEADGKPIPAIPIARVVPPHP